MIKRLDPAGCGCTDCLVGDYSKPLDKASEEELVAAANGLIENATGRTLTLRSSVEIS